MIALLLVFIGFIGVLLVSIGFIILCKNRIDIPSDISKTQLVIFSNLTLSTTAVLVIGTDPTKRKN